MKVFVEQPRLHRVFQKRHKTVFLLYFVVGSKHCQFRRTNLCYIGSPLNCCQFGREGLLHLDDSNDSVLNIFEEEHQSGIKLMNYNAVCRIVSTAPTLLIYTRRI